MTFILGRRPAEVADEEPESEGDGEGGETGRVGPPLVGHRGNRKGL